MMNESLNPPITAHEHDLLTLVSQTFLFPMRSSAVIDRNEKHNGWSPRVIERQIKVNLKITITGLKELNSVSKVMEERVEQTALQCD